MRKAKMRNRRKVPVPVQPPYFQLAVKFLNTMARVMDDETDDLSVGPWKYFRVDPEVAREITAQAWIENHPFAEVDLSVDSNSEECGIDLYVRVRSHEAEEHFDSQLLWVGLSPGQARVLGNALIAAAAVHESATH